MSTQKKTVKTEATFGGKKPSKASKKYVYFDLDLDLETSKRLYVMCKRRRLPFPDGINILLQEVLAPMDGKGSKGTSKVKKAVVKKKQ